MPQRRAPADSDALGHVDILIAGVHPRMGSADLPWPGRKSALAAGYDCVAAIDEPIELWPGRLVKVPLGFSMALPPGWEAQVRPRSGLSAGGIIMPNSPGTVDADYRGEVSALLCYLGARQTRPTAGWLPVPFTAPREEWPVIHPGNRICQMVIQPLADVAWHVTDIALMPETNRGTGGFGSTGV